MNDLEDAVQKLGELEKSESLTVLADMSSNVTGLKDGV